MVSIDRFGLLKIFGGGSYYNNGNVLFFSIGIYDKFLLRQGYCGNGEKYY